MSEWEPKNGREAAALHLCRTLPQREREAWIAAGQRIADGVPEAEAAFDMFRSLGMSIEEAHAEVEEVLAEPCDWRQMLM